MSKATIQVDQDDLAQLLTATADILSGYGVRDLSDGWRQSAARLASGLRTLGCDDDGTWDQFTGSAEPDPAAYDDNGNLRAGDA